MKHAVKQGALSIVLLSVTAYQAAFADTTLVYSLSQGKDNTLQMSYQIRQHQVRITDDLSPRVNLYDSQKQQFTSLDNKTRKISLMNMNILNQRVTELNQERLERVKTVEKQLEQKLKDMPDKEKNIGISLLNQLKYPDLYGEHTLLELKKGDSEKTIQDIPCKSYHLVKQDQVLKDYCIAPATALGMTNEEARSLGSLYQFEYTTQSKLSLAMGRSNFRQADFKKAGINGIIIEQLDYNEGKPGVHRILKRVDHGKLEAELFRPVPVDSPEGTSAKEQ